MKPTINEIEIAKKIVNDLIEHNFFDAIICEDCDGFYCWRDAKKQKNYLKEAGLSAHSGETKACIISDKLSNWVIKVGYTYSDDEGRTTTDFCAIEAKNYKDAIDEGLEEFFAASYELCRVTPPEKYKYEEDIVFFIQEKAEPDDEKTSATCEKYTGSDCNDDFDRVESLFQGNEKLDSLFEFIDDWNINDLHSGNFGYTKEGKVKIIDYSGY
jgi:hypothetical protein